jgi:ribosomal protein L37AE/L43A
MKGDATGQGYNFGGEKVVGMSRRLRQIEAENRKRVPCPKCGNLVRPELLDQHDRAYHA